MEFIELQNDLDMNAKFLSNTLLQLCKECLLRFQNVLKIYLGVWKYSIIFANNSFLRLNFVNPRFETEFQMHM